LFTNLSNSTKALLFYVFAFGLTVCVALLAPLLGGIYPILHMYTPTLAVLIMMWREYLDRSPGESDSEAVDGDGPPVVAA